MSKTILVVEDNKDLSQLLADTFTDHGFVVEIAQDGEEGLAKALKINPDLILLDMLMPKMGGNEFLKKLRDDPAGKDVKVIVLTNSESSEQVLESMNYGVTDYLTKADWELSDLVAKVKERLEIS